LNVLIEKLLKSLVLSWYHSITIHALATGEVIKDAVELTHEWGHHLFLVVIDFYLLLELFLVAAEEKCQISSGKPFSNSLAGLINELLAPVDNKE
jgi:hypothetical protein